MDENVQEFLKRIAELESSSGLNTEHRTMESGIHAGDTAIGTYGLMPNTIDEIVTRARRKKESSPEMNALLQMSGDEKKEYLQKNPELEYKLAERLATRVLKKQGGDEEKAAYSWLYGHNLTPEKIEERGYQDDSYVQKMKNLRGTAMAEEKKQPLIPINPDEEQKLKQYIEGLGDPNEEDRRKNQLRQSLREQLEKEQTGMLAAAKGPFADVSPEEEAAMQDINPFLKSFIQGGPMMGTVGKVGAAAKSSGLDKFLKLRESLNRSGGYAQRLGAGKTASELSKEAGQTLVGQGPGTLQDAAIKQQLANKLRGLK